MPVIAPVEEKIPSETSAALWKEVSMENVTPSIVGAPGLPVPSTHESFCCQTIPNIPALLGLNMGPAGFCAFTCNVIDCSVQLPTPKFELNDAMVAPRLNLIRLWNSPCGFPLAETPIAPAAP